MKSSVSKAVLAAAAFVIALVNGAAWTADYPARPVRFIVPYPPGGGADTLARIVTKGLATRWYFYMDFAKHMKSGMTLLTN